MKKQNGITLIALVISIIVMLILASVSINAIVGDNGVLTKAQYSSFMNEMVAVEEAVQLWKAGELMESKGQVSTAIPTNGLCNVNELTATERLVGEIGYYRTWSINNTIPDVNILSSATVFNESFKSEFVFYPAGVQDLYYLNNEVLDLNEDKVYLIDAATSMVYSMSGITLNGVRCYSTSMAKAVTGGINTAPMFAEAEVSGTGNGEILAGNVQEEFLPDGRKNPDYNPNGFQIISSQYSNNVYKLYNNGDLYGKGVKGTQLNTSADEMENINNLNWTKFTVPSVIGSYKEVIQGSSTMFVIDSKGYLWAWGDNASNKLGLTIDEQQEYTGREAMKLNVAGKTVSKVFSFTNQTFVITTDNCLYSMGLNTNYELGLGHNNEILAFTQVNFDNVEKIATIFQATESRRGIIIETTENKYYATGNNIGYILGKSISLTYTKFAPIWDGYRYIYDENTGKYIINSSVEYEAAIDFDSRIKKVVTTSYVGFLFLFEDNCVYHIGATKYMINNTNSYSGLTQLSTEFSTEVKSIYGVNQGMLIWRENGEIWACNGVSDNVGLGEITHVATLVTLPQDLVDGGIKEIFTTAYAVYYLSNDNILYASCSQGAYVGLEYKPTGVVKLETPKFMTLYPTSNNIVPAYSGRTTMFTNTMLFEGIDGAIYSVNSPTILFRDNILQKNYNKIASNVASIALGPSNSIAYVERGTNNLYVAGEDSSMLGLGTSTQTKITNFVQVNDENINGQVKEVQFATGTMYVLTTNGKLYGTGTCGPHNTSALWNYHFPGWEEIENRYSLEELLSGVTHFSIHDNVKIALSNNIIYTWGMNRYGNLQGTNYVPTEWDLSDVLDMNNIKKIYGNYSIMEVLLNDGSLFIKSYKSPDDDSKIGRYAKNNWNNITAEFKGDIIKDFVTMNGSATYQLTESGNVYGWGSERYLGIGSSNSSAITITTQLGLENIVQMTVGNGFVIAITEDGKVYGTGSNTYGILGRWVGIGRGESNSRYKTAFNWVECPELEI